MATYHCSVKVGAKGKAGPHATYICREGKYQDVRSNEKLEHVESGNMPPWAKNDPAQFWQAADQHERANGATYREIEIALPRELNQEQRLALVRDFVTEEIGNHHAYTFAIHTPQAAIAGGEQPHAHIMYSERTRDDIERDPEQYFRRYNAKHPEKGGCRKDSAGTEERLQATRQRWGSIQNAHLERHGHDARVDHRSLKQQGIDRTPEPHLGPARISRMERIGGDQVAAILEQRHAEGAKERADADLKTSILDLSGDLVAAKAERNKIISQEKEERDEYRTAAFNRVDAACRATVRSSGATNRAGAFIESDIGSLAQEHRAIDTANGRISQAIGERRHNRNAGKALDAVGIVIERTHSTLARAATRLEAIAKERRIAEHQAIVAAAHEAALRALADRREQERLLAQVNAARIKERAAQQAIEHQRQADQDKKTAWKNSWNERNSRRRDGIPNRFICLDTQVTRDGRSVHRWAKGAAAGKAAVIEKDGHLSPAGKYSPAKADAMAFIAKTRGWPSVTITGDDAFKAMALHSLLRAGVVVRNPELQAQVQAWHQARQPVAPAQVVRPSPAIKPAQPAAPPKAMTGPQKAVIAAIEKKIETDGLTPEQRAIVMARVHENVAKAAPTPGNAVPEGCILADNKSAFRQYEGKIVDIKDGWAIQEEKNGRIAHRLDEFQPEARKKIEQACENDAKATLRYENGQAKCWRISQDTGRGYEHGM